MPEHFLGREGIAADLGSQFHIFQGSEVLDQVIELEYKADVMPAVFGELPGGILTDLPSIHPDLAAVTGIHAAQDIEDGGFAGAGRADDHHKLSLVNIKGDVIGGSDGDFAHLIPLDYMIEGNIGHIELSCENTNGSND